MTISQFSYHHPKAYRRTLTAALLLTLASGIVSMAGQHHSRRISFSDLTLPVPAAAGKTTPVSPAKALTRLPGSDGSAPAGEVTAVPTLAVTDALDGGGDARGLGRRLSAARFGDSYWLPLDHLWTRESNWNPNARNAFSGACGIPQALPCSKIHDMSPQGQITWGLDYIARRYGNPANAWMHEQSYGWY